MSPSSALSPQARDEALATMQGLSGQGELGDDDSETTQVVKLS